MTVSCGGNREVSLLSSLLCLLLAGSLGGCIPSTPQTPYPSLHFTEPKTGTPYTLYVPSFYTPDRDWPMVIPLHGTPGFDKPDWQVQEWKDTAEQHGLIVAAPQLVSAQGIVPQQQDIFLKHLEQDERAILAMIDDVATRYRIDLGNKDPSRELYQRPAILITGFSGGGYPMYYTGMRNPERFGMMVAGAANSSDLVFGVAPASEELRKMPIAVWVGKDDNPFMHKYYWQAYGALRGQKFRCFQTEGKEIKGGHLRRPDQTYRLWLPHLPQRHRM